MPENPINQAALEAIILDLLSKLPAFVVEASDIYVSAMVALLRESTLNEVLAFQRLILRGLHLDALSALRERMSGPELAAEKKQLAELTKTIADEQYESLQLGKNILTAILKAGMLTALAAVGL